MGDDVSDLVDDSHFGGFAGWRWQVVNSTSKLQARQAAWIVRRRLGSLVQSDTGSESSASGGSAPCKAEVGRMVYKRSLLEVVSFPAPSRVSLFFLLSVPSRSYKEKKALKPRCESAASDAEQAAIKGLLRAGVVARLTNSGKQRAWEEEEVKRNEARAEQEQINGSSAECRWWARLFKRATGGRFSSIHLPRASCGSGRYG